MSRQEIYIKLTEFKQNCFAWHNGPKAKAALDELKELLTVSDYEPLALAHYDFRSGNGTEYFYRVIENLISKYRQEELGENKMTFL